jgi:hypothetical protein
MASRRDDRRLKGGEAKGMSMEGANQDGVGVEGEPGRRPPDGQDSVDSMC